MSDEFDRIIAKFRAKRDHYAALVSQYTESIRLLELEKSDAEPETRGRFMPRTKPRTKRGAPKRVNAVRKEPAPKASTTLSVREAVREAVLSQTQGFTNTDIRSYLEVRHPATSVKIAGDRLSKELYYLRVEEELFDIESKGDKGGANVYKRSAA